MTYVLQVLSYLTDLISVFAPRNGGMPRGFPLPMLLSGQLTVPAEFRQELLQD